MKKLNHLDPYRVPLMGDLGDEYNGAFEIKIKGEKYSIIASNGDGWEHISVSSKYKIPSWSTMCKIKDLFFEENEVVMQIHPSKNDYINVHKNCLHLWRPINQEIPVPPIYMV